MTEGSLDTYIKAQRENLEVGKQSPYFKDLLEAIHRAYKVALGLKLADDYPRIFAKFFMICHKSLLSAGVLIAQRQPEDSGAITRRAVETAKTALAIKLNEKNVQLWIAFDDRHSRWVTRQKGGIPRPFHFRPEGIGDDPLMEMLNKYFGILSDTHVHFTPEFYSVLDWQERPADEGPGGEIGLNFFHTNDRQVELQFITLGTIHGRILDVFDRCFDGRFRQDAAMLSSLKNLWRIGKTLNDQYQQKYGEPSGVEIPGDETAPESAQGSTTHESLNTPQ